MADLNWSVDGASWPHRQASRFVQAAGLRWHVQEIGKASDRKPALLLIHGTGASTHSWRRLMPPLAPHFHILAVDLPGHGFTQMSAPGRLSLPGMAGDLAALLKALEVRPDVAVGHSAGAAILARMCLSGTIAPRVVVSLNGAFLPFRGVAAHLFSPLAKMLTLNPLVPRLFAWQAGSDGAVERLLRDTGSTLDAEGVALYRRLVRSPSHVAAALRMMANWELEPLVRDLPALATKLVLVAALGDRAIAPEVAAKVHAMVPGSEIVRLPQLGHLAHEERPDEIAELVLQKFRDQPGGSVSS